MSRADLDRVREWSTSKLSACQEPLSTWHPYIKVLQSVDTVLARMNCCDPPWDNGLGTQLNNTFTSISTKLK